MKFEASIVIKVARGKDGRPFIYKPEEAGFWSDIYSVIENPAGRPVIFVKYPPGPPSVVLQLECENDVITGVGFSECCESVELYTEGPCGGCFFLRNNLASGKETTAFIENWGHTRKDGYHLNISFGSGLVFDPQIYNEGVIHDPDDGRRREGWLLRLLLRLVAWLRRRACRRRSAL
jgi:hypothetical protein